MKNVNHSKVAGKQSIDRDLHKVTTDSINYNFLLKPTDITPRPLEPAFASDATLPENPRDQNDNNINEEVSSTLKQLQVAYSSME